MNEDIGKIFWDYLHIVTVDKFDRQVIFKEEIPEIIAKITANLREFLLAEIPKDHTEENPKCECDECYILFQVKEVIKKVMV